MIKTVSLLLLGTALAAGCQTGGADRIPATTVDNPDPIFGGVAKPRQDTAVAATTTPATKTADIAAAPASLPAMPTGQRATPTADRIGPLTVNPPPKPSIDQPMAASSAISPGT